MSWFRKAEPDDIGHEAALAAQQRDMEAAAAEMLSGNKLWASRFMTYERGSALICMGGAISIAMQALQESHE